MSVARPSRSAVLALSITFALGLPVSAVLAQEAATPAKPQPTKTTELQTVNVTASKRVENMQKVPMALTVLTPDKLEAFGQAGDTVLQLASRAPSVYAETSYGREFPRFYIRGLGNSDFDLNASQPVSMVYDDIVQENPILKGFPLFDLAQVEVLRGPQGTLFGRNSPAGVIKFESVRPSQETSGYARVSYGSLGTANAEAALGGALGGHWSGRVSALAQHRDGWIDNTFTGQKNVLGGYNDRAVRLQALYENDGFSALINGHARWLDGSAMVNRANAIELGGPSFVPGFDRDKVAQDGRNKQHLFSWGSNLHLAWNLGDYTFTSITGLERATTYSLGDVDGGYGASFHPPMGPGFIPFPSETADALPHDRQITQEFRLASNGQDKLNWQVGTYYFDEDIAISNFDYATFNNHALDGYASQTQRTKAWAVFGSANYQLADDFELRAGARWSHDSRDFKVDALPVADRRGSAAFDRAAARRALERRPHRHLDAQPERQRVRTRRQRLPRAQRAGPRAVRRLHLAGQARDDHQLRAGREDHRHGQPRALQCGRLYVNMHNQQLTAVGGDINVTRLLNASKTQGYGAEFDLEAYLTPNFVLTAGGSYNHTELKDPNLAVAVCGSGCTILDPLSANGNALVYGNTLPNAPKWIGTLTARYGIPYGDSGEFFVYTDWNYRSEVNFFLYDSAEFKGKPLLEGGVRLGYNWDYGRREVALYGRNVTNKQAITGAIDFNNRTAFVNDPRIIGVEFRAEL